jgi:hypothetical protein
MVSVRTATVMNIIINQALKRATEKVIHRPLTTQEEKYVLAGFYSAEGSLTDRIIAALVEGTHVPRGLIERAAAKSAGDAGIAEEIAEIHRNWLARN